MGPSAHEGSDGEYGVSLPPVVPGPAGTAGEKRVRPSHKEPATGTAGQLLVTYLAQHTAELRARGQALRSGDEEGAHRMRVAARRLRSALTTYGPLLDREVTDPVSTELRWLGEVLGTARDAEVLHDHVGGLVDAEPDDLVVDGVRVRLEGRLSATQRAAHTVVLEALDSKRYERLLEALDKLIASPPPAAEATATAKEVMPRLVARDVERLLRAVRTASPVPPGEQRDVALHEVRKKAKRVRYAAELAGPALGRPARTLARTAKRMQETLGEQHDSVVARQRLWEYGVAAHRDGRSTFTHGRLHAQEQARADRAEAKFVAKWERVWRRQLYRWIG